MKDDDILKNDKILRRGKNKFVGRMLAKLRI